MEINLKEKRKDEIGANIFNLKEQNIIRLTNSLGEETGIKEITTEAYDWYIKTWVDSEWLQYLVEWNGEIGIIAIQEFSHHNCDNWEEDKQTLPVNWAQATPEEIWTHLEEVAKRIAEKLHPAYKVFLGNETGFLGEHEVGIWFPYLTDTKNIEQSFEQIAELSLI